MSLAYYILVTTALQFARKAKLLVIDVKVDLIAQNKTRTDIMTNKRLIASGNQLWFLLQFSKIIGIFTKGKLSRFLLNYF